MVDAENTVIVMEHSLHLIQCADHSSDLGPEGGTAGRQTVAEDTPEESCRYTGKLYRAVSEIFLRKK